jgi:MFS family permease
MAIILGLLNLLGSVSGALFILFAQEVLKTTVFLFAVLGTAGAVGGILGGLIGPKISSKLGSGRALAAVLFLLPIFEIGIGASFHWAQVWLLISLTSFMSVIWNVITVSLRQSIIPSHLLGRVNSVYRLFAWGSIPIGLAIAGGLVQLVSIFAEREWALRTPYLLAGIAGLLLFMGARIHLTEDRISRAKAAAESPTT